MFKEIKFNENTKKYISAVYFLALIVMIIACFLPFTSFGGILKLNMWDLLDLASYEIDNPGSVGDRLGSISLYGAFFALASLIALLFTMRKNCLAPGIILLLLSWKFAASLTSIYGELFGTENSSMEIGSFMLMFVTYLFVILSILLIICGIAELIAGQTGSSDTVTCPSCMTKNKLTASHCTNCGKDLYAQPQIFNNGNSSAVSANAWKCPGCGTENSLSSKFCSGCGNARK